MTQENKEFLFKDICARLPYSLKYNYGGYNGCDYTMNRIDCNTVDCAFPIENIKPYLFPISSMTDEQEKEYNNLNCYELGLFPHTEEALDYLLKNHFDYRGLIDKGLAIDATDLNIY